MPSFAAARKLLMRAMSTRTGPAIREALENRTMGEVSKGLRIDQASVVPDAPPADWKDGSDDFDSDDDFTGEYGGPKGLEPTRFGDWERKGRCTDF
mmetsp:Transcript_17045/g.46049  ORF Transcript_17045/g.46049 Transcript_17045/m.46049 type:complete len:96 (-) Transcript_17045:325-612(-)